MYKTFFTLLILASLACSANAAINITNNGVAGIDVEITQPISFTVNSSIGNAFVGSILFEEWVTSDTLWNSASAVSPSISISLNGGAFNDIDLNSLNDNEVGGNPNDISPNDGQLQWNPPEVLAWLPSQMTSLTIDAQTLTFDQTSGFNPGAYQSFTGDVTLVTTTGIALATTTVVPEPGASALIMALAAFGFLTIRRRKS